MSLISPFEQQLVWASVHQRGRTLLNRLTAAAAHTELLEEAADQDGSAALGALRVELVNAARDARALLDTISAELPVSAAADLGEAVRDTLAPLRRHLARRNTRIVEQDIPHGVCVALEPELLRAAIAAVIDGITASALPSEVLRITHAPAPDFDSLYIALEGAGAPSPELTGLDLRLASLCAWLDARGGSLRVKPDGVELLLPKRGTGARQAGMC
jgi:hypothetical protein